MTNSDGKTTPGADFYPPPAVVWNSMIDAGRAHANAELSRSAGRPVKPRHTDIVKVKNTSAASRRRGEILQFGDKAITNLAAAQLWLTGGEPSGGYFGILRAPATVDEIVDCQLSGACLAFVNITSTSHTRADATSGNFVLQSGNTGPLEIVYAPAETGEQECLVRFAGESASSTTPTTGGTSCPCTVVTGVIDPVPNEFGFTPFGSRKLAYRWKLNGLVDTLNANGFSVTESDLYMTWASENVWQSAAITRTCSSAISDDYVLAASPANGYWVVWLEHVDGVGSKACDDEIYWVWKGDQNYPQPDRTNEVLLSWLTADTRHGDGWVDPPEMCVGCLVPVLGQTRTIACPYGDIEIPEVIQLTVADDATFADTDDFAWGPGGFGGYYTLDDKTAVLSELWSDVAGSYIAELVANEVSPGVFEYYYEFPVAQSPVSVNVTPVGTSGTTDTLTPIATFDTVPFHRWRLSVGCCEFPGRLRLSSRFAWSSPRQDVNVIERVAIELDGLATGVGAPWEFNIESVVTGADVAPTAVEVTEGSCPHSAVGQRVRMYNRGPYSGGIGSAFELLASGGVTVSVRML